MTSSLRLLQGLLILAVAAVLEIAGDAIIRRGLNGKSLLTVTLGFASLGVYGIAVNLLKQDFSRTLGTYAGVFALGSVLAGKVVFGDRIGGATWLGLTVILLGCAIIQIGSAPR